MVRSIKLFSLLLMVVLTCIFIACGQDVINESTPVPTQTPEPEPSYYSVIFDENSKNRISVSGFDSQEGNVYYVTKEMTIDLNYEKENDFNYYKILYTSDNYLEGWLSYESSQGSIEEVFYLEPGENVTFSGLINNFLDGNNGTKITKIVFKAFKGKKCHFDILSLSTDIRDVPDSEFVYIQNDNYKFGIDLSMGGGVCYLEDLKDNDDSLGNLLNRADEGRLIQQSYYGDIEAPYKPEKYNGTLWSYNPVQGGDLHKNRSKIVDFTVNEDSIYIKCIPMDWAQNGVACQCYMENVYSLKNGYIQVRNRFIDYSGYMRISTPHQELPAVYVISYLDTFHYYAGGQPWTNDTLTTKKDLPFWGGNQNAYFTLRSTNDERWCAWTDANGYGLGIYNPIAKQFIAGRFSYNGTKESVDGATNYVAPLITAKMERCKVFEYDYYVTTGNLQSIRDTFKIIYDDAK